MSGLKVKRKLHGTRGQRGRQEIHGGDSPVPLPEGRVPRISRLMALAIHLEQLVQDGGVKDYAELARVGQVSRARVSQILNLLNLAPDIQEQILLLPRVRRGREPIREHAVRPVAAVLDWRRQRHMWTELTSATI